MHTERRLAGWGLGVGGGAYVPECLEVGGLEDGAEEEGPGWPGCRAEPPGAAPRHLETTLQGQQGGEGRGEWDLPWA